MARLSTTASGSVRVSALATYSLSWRIGALMCCRGAIMAGYRFYNS